MTETGLYLALAYFALFIFGSFGLSLWRIKRRKTRPPLETKLLRAPGETLRKRIAEYDERLFFRMAVASLVPLAAIVLAGKAIILVAPKVGCPIRVWYGIWALAFLTALIPTVRWVLRDLDHYRAYCLGYFGERVVGEKLSELVRYGYTVFHDVPGQGQRKPFNLDHVAVGPSGMAVIETKTVRKKKTRPGVEDFKVFYDGEKLHWPEWENRLGLDQAVSNADWLRKWILKQTGLSTPVRPILTFPGWWVEMRGRGLVTVVDRKHVCDAVIGTNARILSDSQIDLIARQLDTLCRDVED